MNTCVQNPFLLLIHFYILMKSLNYTLKMKKKIKLFYDCVKVETQKIYMNNNKLDRCKFFLTETVKWFSNLKYFQNKKLQFGSFLSTHI